MQCVRQACQGTSAVIHTASIIDFNEKREEVIMNVNVKGRVLLAFGVQGEC